MIPLAVPNLSGNEREYLNQCIDTTFVSSVGEFVTRLEKDTCKRTGAKYGVAVSSGTTGLHLALMAAGVKANELVIIPSFTFIATANAVAHCGAIPWCMDIDQESWTLDPAILQEQLEQETSVIDGQVIHSSTGKRVAAIMPVYTLGNVPDMRKIRGIAEHYNLPVIADAAAAIGCTYHGETIGELADFTVFSFNGNKTITCGGGGMVVGCDKESMDFVRHISTTARVSAEYDHDVVGYNYRMTNLCAAVGCAQLEQLDSFLLCKRSTRQFYKQELSDIKEISFFPETSWCHSSCWFSGVVLNKNTEITVKEVCAYLKEHDIEARSFWKPIHNQAPYKNAPRSDMDVTNDIWSRIITLPCSTNISEDERETVVKHMRYFFTKAIK